MPISYQQVVPWGRSFDEYTRMFNLDERDLARSILGCGDGPASFNFGMHHRGRRVTSVDPIYGLERTSIEQRIEATYPIVLEQTRSNRHLFRWAPPIDSVETLAEVRLAAMREFLEDYERGKAEGRYIEAELPTLPFSDEQFDLVLCSHLLFLYSDNLDLEFHRSALDEMLRVGREVRVFPVLDTNARQSRHLSPVMESYGRRRTVQLVTSNYEFQIGGNAFLRIA